MSQYILAIDAGTTGITLNVYDKEINLVREAYSEFPQYYPQEGWVEQDANEIWDTTLKLVREIGLDDIAAIGITNQRETVVAWDKDTSAPLHKAIVWQCRRTAEMCQTMSDKKEMIKQKTGLVLDAYFSGTKVKWLRDNVPAVAEGMEKGTVKIGNIDTWLLWKLTGGQVHGTDFTNASRTMLYNIHEKKWDSELLDLFQVPAGCLPEVHHSSHSFGHTDEEVVGKKVLIGGIAGDQQAALFGQKCVSKGEFKNTYGTGCFLILNTGEEAIDSRHGLLTTLACDDKGAPAYALEGSVFIAGAVVQWLRDGIKLIGKAEETEEMARSVPSSGGVYFLPAFVGMGAPYWDMDARGAILGLTQGTTRAHITRAALESITFQTRGLIDAIVQECEFDLANLRVDGGATANDFLMEFQSNILQLDVVRPKNIQSTALGAAFLAGLAGGYWTNMEEIKGVSDEPKTFSPTISKEEGDKLYSNWKNAVERVLNH